LNVFCQNALYFSFLFLAHRIIKNERKTNKNNIVGSLSISKPTGDSIMGFIKKGGKYGIKRKNL
jgi:hypothetical protein